MTLHIAFFSREFVCCVGDRLLTTEQRHVRKPWDTYSNKTIVVDSHSARFTVCYSGLAHIKRMPTDEWLAGLILGSKFPDRAARLGGTNKVNYQSAIEAIRGGLEGEFNSLPEFQRRQRLVILMAGWEWNRRSSSPSNPRPFTTRLEHKGNANATVQVERGPIPRTLRPAARFATWIGADLSSERENLDAWLDSLTGIDAVQIENELVRIIRSIAKNPNAGVGTELMSVMMPRDGVTCARFIRDLELQPSISGYSPFVISRNLLARPTNMRGEWNWGGIELECIPPFSTADGVFASFSTQQRKPADRQW